MIAGRLDQGTGDAEDPRLLGSCIAEAEGPTIVAIGGVHGNERAGIEAIHRVLDALSTDIALESGRFFGLLGNLAALGLRGEVDASRPRYIDRDLNRLFRDHPAADMDDSEFRERDELRLHLERIAAASSGQCVVLDLHTLSSRSTPFIALEDSLPARRFGMAFPLPKVLGIEEVISGLLMDEATSRLGCVSLTVEGGQHEDPGSIDVLEAVLWTALDRLGMLSPGARELVRSSRRILRNTGRPRCGCVYDVRFRARVTHDTFCAVPEAEAFSPVRSAKSVIGHEDGMPVLAGETGLLFMVNRQTKPRPGDDAFFIVRRVECLLRSSFFALSRHRDESHRQDGFLLDLSCPLLQQVEFLNALLRSHRNDHSASFL